MVICLGISPVTDKSFGRVEFDSRSAATIVSTTVNVKVSGVYKIDSLKTYSSVITIEGLIDVERNGYEILATCLKVERDHL